MLTFLIATLGAFVGGGLSAIINALQKRRLTHKQEEQTKAKTEEIVVNTLSKAIETLNSQVVEPLRKENESIRSESNNAIKGLKHEVAKLRKAIEKIIVCDHADSCPVTRELQNYKGSDKSSN